MKWLSPDRVLLEVWPQHMHRAGELACFTPGTYQQKHTTLYTLVPLTSMLSSRGSLAVCSFSSPISGRADHLIPPKHIVRQGSPLANNLPSIKMMAWPWLADPMHPRAMGRALLRQIRAEDTGITRQSNPPRRAISTETHT